MFRVVRCAACLHAHRSESRFAGRLQRLARHGEEEIRLNRRHARGGEMIIRYAQKKRRSSPRERGPGWVKVTIVHHRRTRFRTIAGGGSPACAGMTLLDRKS